MLAHHVGKKMVQLGRGGIVNVSCASALERPGVLLAPPFAVWEAQWLSHQEWETAVPRCSVVFSRVDTLFC